MTVGYSLVNNSKKEQIMFLHLPATTMDEIVNYPVSAFIVDWYRKSNPNDEIEFVSDTYDDWPFKTGDRTGLIEYPDITDSVLSELISLGLVIDNGVAWQDEDEPESVYIRDLELA